MAFFSAQNAGLAFMIVAVLSIIAAIIGIVCSVMDVEGFDKYKTLYYIVVGIGELIVACMYFTYGKKIRSGEISAKIDILAQFVKIVGIATIVSAIFLLVAEFVGSDEFSFGAAAGSAALFIIIGLILIFIAGKINDGKQTTGDKIIWILLLIAFILGIIGAVGEIISIILIINGICDLIIYVFMFILLIDPEVKEQMNM